MFVETPGKNRALNRALGFADGDLIVFTDDDVLPATNWLAELVAATRRWPDADFFGGQTLLAMPPGAPDWILDAEERAVNCGRYAPQDIEAPTSATPFGANVAIRRALIESFEFDEGVGPDGTAHYAMGSETAFLLRASRAGHQIVYVPSAKLWHVVRPEQLSRRALASRSYRFGRGWARVVEPTPDVPHLFGAPRWLWRSLLHAGLDRLSARLTPGHTPVEPLLRYRRVRGMIAEYRGSAGAR